MTKTDFLNSVEEAKSVVNSLLGQLYEPAFREELKYLARLLDEIKVSNSSNPPTEWCFKIKLLIDVIQIIGEITKQF